MKNLFKLSCLSLVLVFALGSCSKEKRYEHKLTRKDGLWTISEFTCDIENDTTSYSIAQEYSGTIQFNKNGTYVENLIIDGNETPINGTWTNTEFQLTLTPTGQKSIQLSFNSVSKKNIAIKSRNIDWNQGNYEFYSMTLEKK